MANTSLIVMGPKKEKRQVYEAIGVNMSIDDKIETVADCATLAGHTAYLLDQKWNRSDATLPRTTSVEEFCQAVLAQNFATSQQGSAQAPQP